MARLKHKTNQAVVGIKATYRTSSSRWAACVTMFIPTNLWMKMRILCIHTHTPWDVVAESSLGFTVDVPQHHNTFPSLPTHPTVAV